MIDAVTITFIIALLCGHLIGDFVLQFNIIAKRKKDHIGWLVVHVGIVTLVTWILVGDISAWLLMIVLFGLHLTLDCLKNVVGKNEKLADYRELFFVGDQILHILTLILLTVAMVFFFPVQSTWLSLWGYGAVEWMVIVCGAIVGIRVGKFVIADRMRPWVNELNKRQNDATNSDETNRGNHEDGPRGLVAAGSTIGQLERLLIFIFVMGNQYEAVGFLIAAKSIFRFSESQKDQKWAEYLLIGSLWSLCIGLLSGLATVGSLQLVKLVFH